MGLRTLVAVLAVAAVAGAAPAAAQVEVPTLRPGDTGPAVRFYQDQINDLLQARLLDVRLINEDGVYGPNTAAETRDIERVAGITVDGVADRETWLALYRQSGNLASRTLRESAATPEWPIPVPSWFWAWARWYLDRGEFAGGAFRAEAERPEQAPLPIPEWAWRRLNALLGRPLPERGEHFVEDRVQAIFSRRLGTRLTEAEVEVRIQGRSELDGRWILLTGTYENVRGGSEEFAAWLRLVRGRWIPWEIGRLGSPRLNLRPALVPCDLKPAFAEAFCGGGGGEPAG